MGLTTAMYSGLSGMNANQTRIETIGNNIANSNTTAFKYSRTLFETQFYNTINGGTAPSSTTGGTNPMQVGLGVKVATNQRIFTAGSIETTGVPSDAAVEGDGFFITASADGMQKYTRDGAFSVNTNNQLVTSDGDFVEGFGVDANFNIIPGVLTNLTIPLGTLAVARSTQLARMDGDLSAAGTPGTQGSITTTQSMVDGGGGAAGAGTSLTDLRSATAPGVALFANGDTITVSGASKGGRLLPTQTFVVGQTGNTFGDFANWLQNDLGIQTGGGVPGTPGVTISGGQLVINADPGEPNAITFSNPGITSTNPSAPIPFAFTQVSNGNGSGVYTAFTVYDSLGAPVQVNATFVLEATPNTGPVWRYYLDSPDASGTSQALGTGTVSFDTVGNYVSASGNQFTIDRSGTGAATPITFTLDLASVNGLSTQVSNVVMAEQDGFPPGTLTGYAIQQDGIIVGTFSNGLSRPLGQLALARFANPEGLLAGADNAYLEGPNSGAPQILTPGTLGAGTILGGALELSNVDLSREFVGLITSSNGFQANSRVISVTNQLLDALLLIVR